MTELNFIHMTEIVNIRQGASLHNDVPILNRAEFMLGPRNRRDPTSVYVCVCMDGVVAVGFDKRSVHHSLFAIDASVDAFY
jgi:hypothetical protein